MDITDTTDATDGTDATDATELGVNDEVDEGVQGDNSVEAQKIPVKNTFGGKRKRKGKRPMNAFFKIMLASKKKKIPSFMYKGKKYVGTVHNRLGMIYRKSGKTAKKIKKRIKKAFTSKRSKKNTKKRKKKKKKSNKRKTNKRKGRK